MSVRSIDSSQREQVSPWLKDVEGEYLPRLIESDKPVIRVIAGPGAGKTFLILPTDCETL